MQTDSSIFRPTTFIEDAKDNLTLAVIIAAVLLALALAAFLFQWRTVLIAVITIPVALTAAALVLDLMGETFNAISFAGLAVALAVVIDDAVIGAENVARRLRRSREAGSDMSISQVVVDATQEVRSPMGYATLHVLQSIASGYVYGFDIMDATDLPSGTVYPILRRLEDDGLAKSRWEREGAARREQRPPRRYYELTGAGETRLAEARARYRALESLAPHLARRWKPA